MLRRPDVGDASAVTTLAKGTADGVDFTKGALRVAITCTATNAGGVTIRVTADGNEVIEAADPDPLPAGQPTFGVSRSVTATSLPCSRTWW